MDLDRLQHTDDEIERAYKTRIDSLSRNLRKCIDQRNRAFSEIDALRAVVKAADEWDRASIWEDDEELEDDDSVEADLHRALAAWRKKP